MPAKGVHPQKPQVVAFNDEEIWNAPGAYAGYLWVVTKLGNLYRVSPAKAQAKLIDNLGKEYGRYPFTITSAAAGERPLIIVAGTRRIAVIDPAVHNPEDEPVVSPSLPKGDVFGSDGRPLFGSDGRQLRDEYFVPLVDGGGYPALAVMGRDVAIVKKRQGGLYLAVWTRGEKPSKPTELALPEGEVCGPLVVGDTFCVYSREHFFWIDDGRITSCRLPRTFAPFVSPEDDQPYPLAWGRAPFVSLAGGAYLPGKVGGSPGLAFVEMVGSRPQFGELELPSPQAYVSGGEDRLVLATEGRVQHLYRTTLTSVPGHSDGQVIPGPALVSSSFVLACAQGAGGVRELRLDLVGHERLRFNLDGGRIPVDVFLFPGYLTMTSLVERHLELVSWPLA